MWRVIKRMYEASRSAVLLVLYVEKSASFSVKQGVARGCSLSPTAVLIARVRTFSCKITHKRNF